MENGVFTVTLEPGTNVFTGEQRWLQIDVRSNGVATAFTALTPRQMITAVPYAMYAMTPAGPQGPQGLKGDKGETGATGSQGLQGIKGDTGAQGPQGAAGAPGLVYRGPWLLAMVYAQNDLVEFNGSAWVAKQANAMMPPEEGDFWGLLVRKGDAGQPGAAGVQGPIGPAGPQGIQGDKGDTGATGPQGPQGLQGPVGPAGLMFRGAWNSTQNYVANDLVSHDGSGWVALRASLNAVPMVGADWELFVAKGDQGDQGPAGADGGSGGSGVAFRGNWSSTINYTTNETVFHNGSSWIARRDNLNVVPVAGDDWALFAQKGADGATGPQGPAGVTGPQGPQGIAGVRGLTFKGAWSSATSYTVDDAVVHGGSAWLAKQANSNVPPVEGAHWTLLVQKGDAGPQGAQGIQGIQGLQGAVGPRGPAGPQGPTGATGSQGPVGPKGVRGLTFKGAWESTTSYVVDDAVFHTGSAWLAKRANNNVAPLEGDDWTQLASKGDPGVQGAQGVTGPQGPQGPSTTSANVLFIGSDQAGNQSGSLLQFGTDGAAAMTILENGNVGIGTVAPASRLTVAGSLSAAGFVGNGALLTNLAPSATVGVFDAGQLPADVVYRPELQSTNAALRSSLVATNDALVSLLNMLSSQSSQLAAQLATVSNRATELELRYAALSNHTATNVPLGVTVASADAADPRFLAQGLQRFASVNAPAWINGSLDGTPASARFGHSLIWTGSKALVWGGQISSVGNLASTGSGYDSVTESWTAINNLSAPAARVDHGAVWTGSEMIVWGGFSGVNGLADGGRYNPATQTWRATAALGAPSARGEHATVWTGSRMVIWGGRQLGNLFADGALYDPAADSWSALPPAGAPVARSRLAAIWAEDRFIVWGGEAAGGPVASGAQIPIDAGGVAGGWTPTATLGAPSARTDHTAVWTGKHMIVWGGRQGFSRLGDGAMYDPEVNLWTPLPSASSPSARYGHSALWTGTEMIIFGGQDAGGVLGNGAAFDPGTGKWRALQNPGSPVARAGSGVVWTGSEVILFGGRSSSGQPLSALQRLDPQPTWFLYRKP